MVWLEQFLEFLIWAGHSSLEGKTNIYPFKKVLNVFFHLIGENLITISFEWLACVVKKYLQEEIE